MKAWNGEFRSLVVNEEANPELYEELARYSHRDRTNRLRTLALIGLFALQHRGRNVGPMTGQDAGVPEPVRAENTAPKQGLDRKRQDLRDRMLGSIE